MVGKYVDLTESYKSLSEALTHAGMHTKSKVAIHYVDSEAIERDGVDALAGMDAILVPGGFGKRGVEGKIRAIRHARENRIPYLGICLGMQLAVIEHARHRAGLAGRELDRVRSGHAASGGRADHRVAGPRRPRRAADRRVGHGRHHAPGRAGLRGPAGHARPPDLRFDERRRAPSPSLRGQQPLPAAARGDRAHGRRAREERGRRRPVRDDRAGRPPVVLRLPVPPRVHVEPAPRPPAVRELRARRARAASAPTRRSARWPSSSRPCDEALRLRRRPRASAVPLRRALRRRERDAAGRRRRAPEGDDRGARRALRLQVELRQGEPQLARELPRTGHGRGPAHPRRGAPAGRRAGDHRRAHDRRDRDGRLRRRRAADAGVPLPPDRLHPGGRGGRASRSTSRRASSSRPKT